MFSTGIRDRISDYLLPFYTFPFLTSNLLMGCTSSQAVPPGGNATATDPKNLVDNSNPEAKTSEVSSDDKYPPAEAFEISLNDVDNDNDDRSDSLIKKHPPKRLQKLVEQAATAVPATTIEHLEEKLAKAEVRRQQYIQQRIENIITLTSKGGNGGEVSGGGEGETEEDGNKNDDLNDGQKDAEAAVIVSRNTTITTSTSSTTSSNSNSSQDADIVVQPTTSLTETSASVDKKHIDGEHHAQGADNGTHP